MHPKPSVLVTIRLEEGLHERYAAEAAAKRTPLSTYLRERLEHDDQVLAELAILRRIVEQGGPDSAPSSVLLELLLLVRGLSKPDALRTAAAELHRNGLEPWRAPEPSHTTRSPRSADRR